MRENGGAPDWDVPTVGFTVGDDDRIYTKHPPLPPADVIHQDVRDVATVVLCERVLREQPQQATM